jgi:UDP-GlcNAc:undecaprenyl-phosphate GlcNAc-1-phosphate transferase
MNIGTWQYFLLFIATYTSVGFLTPIMRKVAISKKILDIPNSAHKSHTSPTPYLGGVAIIIGVVLVTYSALLFSESPKNNIWLATSLIGPAFVMGLVGLWDDIKNLHPLPRFIAQTISGMVVAVILILTDNFGTPTGSISLDIFITMLWVVGICNSINFFDNLDGGAAGTVAIIAFTLTYLSIISNQIFISALSVVVTGATLGFLLWNKSPARIYMGDAGALFLGVLIATLSIRLKPSTESPVASYAIPVILLAVPILDTSVAVISRLLRKKSPFQGGKDHLSHRLIRGGNSRKKTAILLWLLSAVFNLFAILIVNFGKRFEMVLVIFVIMTWILLFIQFIKESDY